MSDMTVNCPECGKDFERRSMKGRKPGRCYECAEARDKAKLKELANTPSKATRLREDERVAEEKRELARGIVEEEPTWLDDPAVQEQLIQRQQAAIDVIGPSEVVGDGPPLAEFEPPGQECRAPECTTIPTYPLAAPRFCGYHWLQLNHDVRGVLVGVEIGSAPWNASIVKAIRSLR